MSKRRDVDFELPATPSSRDVQDITATAEAIQRMSQTPRRYLDHHLERLSLDLAWMRKAVMPGAKVRGDWRMPLLPDKSI